MLGLQGVVWAELLSRGETLADATAIAETIHAWTLARVRELAAQTPWSLSEMFDRDAPTLVEPLLRALVDST